MSRLVLFALLALVGNGVGALFQYPDIGTAVLFPPYALLTAVLVASRSRDWPSYILAGSAAHLITHWPQWSLSWVLLADVANVVRALVAALMLRRVFAGPPRLDSIRALALFVASAVLVAPAAGATIGAANVMLHGRATTYWLPWSAWFMSNALTGLTMLPACVIAAESIAGGRWLRFDRRGRLEALLLTAALVATCAAAFLPGDSTQLFLALPFYAPVPVLIWAALRFGPGGTSLALTSVASIATWAADRSSGPFHLSSPDDNLLTLQFFVLLTSLPVLCIAVVSSARHRAVRLYRALLASLQDHVAILDADGQIIEVNDSWRRFAETDDQPLHRVRAGENFLDACRDAAASGNPTAVRVLSGVAAVLAGKERRFEVESDHDRNGSREAYITSIEALARSDGGAVVTRVNVTARRQAQGQIDEQRRELSHLARVAVLGQLSGALAHELNQPLTSILSNAEAARHLLRQEPVALDDLSAILQDIATEDRRAAHVIQRLRALLKRGEMRLQPIDPGELVAEVLELAHAELITRRISATALVEPNPPLVQGDRVQLQQVLLNLILNACEAMTSTADGDRRLSLAVRAEAASSVRFSVCDCGTGISPALIDRLFEPFVTDKPGGLGLGLSISRTIVAAHGGRLWAENNPDRGATIHCLLPLTERARGSETGQPDVQAFPGNEGVSRSLALSGAFGPAAAASE